MLRPRQTRDFEVSAPRKGEWPLLTMRMTSDWLLAWEHWSRSDYETEKGSLLEDQGWRTNHIIATSSQKLRGHEWSEIKLQATSWEFSKKHLEGGWINSRVAHSSSRPTEGYGARVRQQNSTLEPTRSAARVGHAGGDGTKKPSVRPCGKGHFRWIPCRLRSDCPPRVHGTPYRVEIVKARAQPQSWMPNCLRTKLVDYITPTSGKLATYSQN